MVVGTLDARFGADTPLHLQEEKEEVKEEGITGGGENAAMVFDMAGSPDDELMVEAVAVRDDCTSADDYKPHNLSYVLFKGVAEESRGKTNARTG